MLSLHSSYVTNTRKSEISNLKRYYYGGLQSLTDYPLHDVKLLITDADSMKMCDNKFIRGRLILNGECYFKHSSETTPKNLPPHSLTFNEYTFKSKANFKRLEIKTTSRNSSLLQQAIFKLMLGSCTASYRIYLLKGEEATLIKNVNELGILDSEWNDFFLPVKNRGINLSDD